MSVHIYFFMTERARKLCFQPLFQEQHGKAVFFEKVWEKGFLDGVQKAMWQIEALLLVPYGLSALLKYCTMQRDALWRCEMGLLPEGNTVP